MTPDPFDDPENHAAVRLLSDGLAVTPPPGLLAALLDRLPGIVSQPADDRAFQPTRHPGVRVRLLHADPAAGRFSAYLELAAGAALPPHTHAGAEECVVLRGSIAVAGRTLRAGDYQRAEAGSPHAEQVSADGCLLFLSGPLALLEE